jgi:hypothetical protein
MFIRFVTSKRNTRSDHQEGIFTALYALIRQHELQPHELTWFEDIEAWFEKNLEKPDRLSGSTRPNAPNRAVTWLKISAAEHVSKMRELAHLLEYKDIPVEELRTSKPGYIVYEDEHQVAAIPFGKETF